MSKGIVANVSTTISAPKSKVWDALVNPTAIKKYMFGTDVVSDWREGSPIVWRGEWKGKPYEDKGTICHVERETRLEYTHFSPLAGQPDKPRTTTPSPSGCREGTERPACPCRKTTTLQRMRASTLSRIGMQCWLD